MKDTKEWVYVRWWHERTTTNNRIKHKHQFETLILSHGVNQGAKIRWCILMCIFYIASISPPVGIDNFLPRMPTSKLQRPIICTQHGDTWQNCICINFHRIYFVNTSALYYTSSTKNSAADAMVYVPQAKKEWIISLWGHTLPLH